MTYKSIILCLVCSIFLAIGQFLFKMAALRFGIIGSWKILLHEILSNYWLLGALFLYACTSALWVYVLRVTPLSLAYAFTAVSYIIVPAVGWIVFKESFSVQVILGMGFVIVGITLIGWTPN